MKLKKYKKGVAAAAGVLVVVGTALQDGDLSQPEIIAILGAVASAVGVVWARNEPA